LYQAPMKGENFVAPLAAEVSSGAGLHQRASMRLRLAERKAGGLEDDVAEIGTSTAS